MCEFFIVFYKILIDNGNRLSTLQSVLLLAYLRCDSNEIYSFVVLSYIYVK